ncbi:MAG: hypothetical protein M5U26_22780 [Planctomycetota bacterium]|nr:hypothetical protein [Planctomycetota bacterium]
MAGNGARAYEFRAADRGLSWLYEPDPTYVRATQALNRTGEAALDFEVNGAAVDPDGLRPKRFSGLLRSPLARLQPGDNAVLWVDLGANLLPAGAEYVPVTILLGDLTLGPFDTLRYGVLKFDAPGGARVRGRIVLTARRRYALIRLINVDLEDALDIDPGDLDRLVDVEVTLVLDGVSAGPVAFTAQMKRRKTTVNGRLVFIEGRIP